MRYDRYNGGAQLTAPLHKVLMYTDGACSGNPGPGGYGVVMKTATKTKDGVGNPSRSKEGVSNPSRSKELSAAFRATTNNRMELMAIIAGLSALKARCEVAVYTDSQLIVNAMTKGWIEKWQANNWITTAKSEVKNIDLWEQLIDLCKRHIVTFNWIRGHSGHPENERCDELAREAIKSGIFIK
ncbi:MAG: ribonuclease HI [Nitrospirae bacterium]|nr:ribonuclease HI [Nitrospirota bacterium]